MNADVETMAFLHVHGLDVQPKGLNGPLRAAIQALQSLYYPEPGHAGLTASEVAVLRSGGLDPAQKPFGAHGDPLLNGVITFAALIETGLTTIQAAKVLHVSDARIRQRLQERTLLAIKSGRSWKLPLFQFAGGGELPGWAQVAPKLPEGISPVAVERWLMLPNPDLVVGKDETPTSPRAWLLEGRTAKTVAALVAGLS